MAGLLACAPVTGALGMEFGIAPDRAEWKLRQSRLECRLSQPVPLVGEAVFRQEAGESARFELNSGQKFLPGDGVLRAEAPPWREGEPGRALGSFPVAGGYTAVLLAEPMAERLLDVLLEGLMPVIDGLASRGGTGTSRVRLVPVNFRGAYADYRNCQRQLLSTPFSQVSRMRIGYRAGSAEFDAATRTRLDQLAEHLAQLDDVTAVRIAGHSDDRLGRNESMELSKQRAQGVVDYLASRGVRPELLKMESHGTFEPVARGRHEAARAQNRRVMLQVDRGPARR
ncbi:MAG: OmpA family protein [Gammaproteobacteria bacterium]